MGRCLSPCDGSVDPSTYAAVVRQLRDSLLRRPDEVVEAINQRMESLASHERFEEAGVHRDRLAAFVRAAARTQRLTALTRLPELVAARREDDGRWAVHVVRHGRLAAAGVIPGGTDAQQYVAELRAAAETVAAAAGPVPAATAEETERILRWLESPGIRLVDVDGEWTCPVGGRDPAPRPPRRGQPEPADAGPVRRPAVDLDRAPAGPLTPAAISAKHGSIEGAIAYRRTMAGMSVRRRLLRDAFLVLAVFLAIHAVPMAAEYGIGWDAHAYYVAWSGGLYEELPGTVDAYNYSPLFAQLIWPLTLLPWPVFCAALVGAAAVGIAWLVRPLPVVLAVGAWLFCLPEILSGNVFWLLARGGRLRVQRTPARGASPRSPRSCPASGPVWFLVRREWRQLVSFVVTAALLLAVSVAISPGEWSSWLDFLRDSAGDSSGQVYLSPVAVPFPLVVRLPLALVVAVVAARTDRAWLLPVAMVLASPVVGWGTFALLAAIPRLRRTAARSPAAASAPAASAPGRLVVWPRDHRHRLRQG